MPAICPCLCHSHVTADYRSARQLEQWFLAAELSYAPDVNTRVLVDAVDVIEAAVAQGCECLPNHCPALLTPRATLLPVHAGGGLPAPVEWSPDEGEESGGGA